MERFSAGTFSMVAGVALGLLTGSIASVHAEQYTLDINVPNFSFEDYHPGANNGAHYANQNPQDNPNPTGILFDDWVTTSANYQLFQNSVSGLASPGDADQNFYVDESIPFSTVVTAETQHPVVGILNNASYDLSVALGVESGKTSADMSIELLVGSTVVAHTDVSGATLALDPGTLTNYNVNFDTLMGDNSAYIGKLLSIAVVTTPTGAFQDGEFDNVHLTETAPEPSTWAMLLLGAGGLVILGHRKIVAS